MSGTPLKPMHGVRAFYSRPAILALGPNYRILESGMEFTYNPDIDQVVPGMFIRVWATPLAQHKKVGILAADVDYASDTVLVLNSYDRNEEHLLWYSIHQVAFVWSVGTYICAIEALDELELRVAETLKEWK